MSRDAYQSLNMELESAKVLGSPVAGKQAAPGPHRQWPGAAWRLALLAAAVYLMLRWFENSQVYIPSREIGATPDQFGIAWEEVRLETEDRTPLHGWFMPGRPGTAGTRRVLLFFHGNAGNISHRLDYYRAWLELGLGVLAVDYRGYGRSGGRPSESGTYQDAQAAYDWLSRRGFAAHQIIVLGKSLGGGIAGELAAREPVGGLILQSTYTSLPDLGAELFPFLPVRWLATIRYDTLGKLGRIRAPILVMHSRSDSLVRFHHAERNYAAANAPKLMWELAGDHNETLLTDRVRYLEGLNRFLAMLDDAAGK